MTLILKNVILETKLKELKVSLNLICLTQSDEIKPSSLTPLFQKRDSVISNEYQNDLESNNQNIIEESNTEKLNEYQFQCLNDCIDKIEWLLKDEIASIALDSYPICESTLEMVIKHIEMSPNSEFCFKKQVMLQFVFGSDLNLNYDISLSRFCQMLSQIKLNGFQLIKIGKYYYISDQKESKEQTNKTQKMFPFIADMSSDLYYHFNDAVLPNSETNKETFDSINSQTNEISFSTPLLQNSSKSFKTNKNKENLSEDSLEDNKIITTRKRLSKRKSVPNRSASVPPNTPIVNKVVKRKGGQSLPEADFEFIKQLKAQENSKIDEKKNENEMEIIENQEKQTNNDLSNCSESEKSQSLKYKSETMGEEEGYEGDSDDDSEIESENWMTFDMKKPLAPKFWLIMEIRRGSVVLYFHTRPKDTSTESYTKGIEIFNRVIALIESICKTVNQMLLLKHLHDT